MSQQPVVGERYVLQVDLPARTGSDERRRIADRLQVCAEALDGTLPGLVARVDLTHGRRPTLQRVPPLTLDEESRTVLVGDRAVTLAQKEFLILRLLCARPGEVVSREELVEALRTRGVQPAPRTVDVHVHRIRAKLGRDGECVATVRGEGYRYVEAARVVVLE